MEKTDLRETEELSKYYQLMKEGIISQEEFESKKAKILSGEYRSTLDKSNSNPLKEVNKKYFIIGGCALACLLLFVFIHTSVLIGNDKKVYDLVKKYQYQFKDPSSVQLVTANYFVGEKEDIVWARISAKNGFGNRTTSCYAITNSYIIESDYCNDTNVNIEKINKKLGGRD